MTSHRHDAFHPVPTTPSQHNRGRAERVTRIVAGVTAAMMIAEIWAGWRFNSMALLADGWHMSTHALAIGLSAAAYAIARRYAGDPRFAAGTHKIETLAAYSSAWVLLAVAALMIGNSIEAFFWPRSIAFPEAIGVTTVGLIVNVTCALILGGAQGHGEHENDHAQVRGEAWPQPQSAGPNAAAQPAHPPRHAPAPAHHEAHTHPHHDLNLRSAYLHVMADAATSVLALVALTGGKLFGWNWLDPVMGVVGALIVCVWALGLLKDAIRVLLDLEPASRGAAVHRH